MKKIQSKIVNNLNLCNSLILHIAQRLLDLNVDDEVVVDELDMLITVSSDTRRLATDGFEN